MDDCHQRSWVERELPTEPFLGESVSCIDQGRELESRSCALGHSRGAAAKISGPYIEHSKVGRTIALEVWVFARLGINVLGCGFFFLERVDWTP